MVAPLMKEGERCSPLPFVQYRVGQKVCPMLRDPASARGGEFTQPRTNFLGHLCTLYWLFMPSENTGYLYYHWESPCLMRQSDLQSNLSLEMKLRKIIGISSLLPPAHVQFGFAPFTPNLSDMFPISFISADHWPGLCRVFDRFVRCISQMAALQYNRQIRYRHETYHYVDFSDFLPQLTEYQRNTFSEPQTEIMMAVTRKCRAR